MKRFAFLMIVVSAIFFFITACSSTEYMVRYSDEKRAPLDSLTKVSFIYGPELPIIPENTELVAVMQTNTNSDCKVDDAVAALENAARELGADLVFVKKYENKIVSRGFYAGGIYVSRMEECQVLTADLLATK